MTMEADRPVGPRSSKGKRTRATLLQAAKEVFEEYGFVETRISDIAERAELSYGAFYHYFTAKDEIFREVAACHERQLGIAVLAEMELVAGPPDTAVPARLEAATRRYLAEYRDEARLMRVIEQVSRFDVVLHEARLHRHKQYAERLAGAIVHLQRQGLADPAVDPTVGSQVIMAMVTRFAEAWFVQGMVDCSFEEGVVQLNVLCLNAMALAPATPDG
ncbi:MAG TPA: TetR/AcrR family transcriptional regulator [Acidimicrobiales bacterium]|nr:TetR/AcrR family transcriptional regulator [Acidimicrobiales bacterium]